MTSAMSKNAPQMSHVSRVLLLGSRTNDEACKFTWTLLSNLLSDFFLEVTEDDGTTLASSLHWSMELWKAAHDGSTWNLMS
mmetsp:Transcript_97642/g.218514  ORF Transcript_97642/g.218514 Transcript_97642/m.218514 type:complete len:81 (-) Transcript_97642:370-612(-)